MGVLVDEPTGFTAKLWTGRENALQVGLGLTNPGSRFGSTVFGIDAGIGVRMYIH